MMLGRRPRKGESAFGHVSMNSAAQAEVDQIVKDLLRAARKATPIDYDPDYAPESGEVMVHPVRGIDEQFQQAAAWSLERTQEEITSDGLPRTISAAELDDGSWSFYAMHSESSGTAATLVRAKGPTHGLKHTNRLITEFVGGELRPFKEPLIGLDYEAEAVIADETVYIFQPQRLERLLVDAEKVKARAPETASKFGTGLAAKLGRSTPKWIRQACAMNANVGRRVERLNRYADLELMTVDALRAGLKEAKLPADAFGTHPSRIDVNSLDHAIALIDIAADLYYQPRFEKNPRRVASFRRLT